MILVKHVTNARFLLHASKSVVAGVLAKENACPNYRVHRAVARLRRWLQQRRRFINQQFQVHYVWIQEKTIAIAMTSFANVALAVAKPARFHHRDMTNI